jgi:Skp family chaperone for outer membrane proteins
MKTLYNSALAAAILLASATPALAQRNNPPAAAGNPAPTGPIVPGIGIANLEAITVN